MNAFWRRLFKLLALSLWMAGNVRALPAERMAMDGWARESWTQQNGLRSEQVQSLAQSVDGYLWIGTPEGVARFNGSEFTYFDHVSVDALHDDDVRQLSVGRDNSLLVATARGGVSFLNQGYWTRRGVADGLSQDALVSAQEDTRGRLWVATASAGVDVFDGRRRLHFDSRSGLPSDRIGSLLLASDGVVWIGTGAGLAKIVDDRVQTVSVNAGLLPSGAITALAEAPDRSLWVGTGVGAYRQRRGDTQFQKMTPDSFDDTVLAILPDSANRAMIGTVHHGLLVVRDGSAEQVRERAPGRTWSVSALLRGNDGSIWVGGSQGLLRLRYTPFSALGKLAGLANENVHAVLETPDGDIWIGSDGGLDRMHDGRIAPVDDARLRGQAVYALASAGDDGLWIGSEANGLLHVSAGRVDRQIARGQGLPSNWVRAIVADRDGGLWIGTAAGLVHRDGDGMRTFGTADGLPNEVIFALYRDSGGRLWVGTGNGLAYRDGQHFVAMAVPHGSMVQSVYGFADGGNGALWIASDRGLLRFKDGRLAFIGSEQGLPADTVYAVVPDREGNLWLPTFSGLMRVRQQQAEAVADGRTRTLAADLYGVSDGLPSAQCNGGSNPSARLLSDGSLWVATTRGIGQVHPDRLAEYRSEPPQVLLEEVRVDDHVVVPAGTLELPAGTRKLDVRFFALNYHLPQRIRYRYLLEGYDADWSEIGEHSSVQFTNLPPGNYRLRIQAAIAGGPWSLREVTLPFHVGAHPWQRPGFIALMVALSIGGAWLAYRARIGVIAANERRLQQLVEARTEDLRRQTEKLRLADAEKSKLLETIQAQAEAFERQAREDALTGLANRRRVDEAIEVYFAESRRSGRSLSVALLDIDHFKRVNDHYSHAVGDDVLRELGAILRAHQRPGDLAGRQGGEEFLCILSGSDIAGARTYCERMRLEIEAHDWSAIAHGLRVTVSMGVAQWDGEETYSRLSSRVDELLYRAKANGRNRVEG
ncbi:MAG: diguanylate cyclase [Proteobacteria bacterium]|nr:diguanylate cyclase [Pseudomonadota bacterium]